MGGPADLSGGAGGPASLEGAWAGREVALVVTAEHGGHEVPEAWRPLFAGHEALLRSHRGWDPGSLEAARFLAEAWGVPLLAATTTRLLVDLNRSEHHRAVFSALTRPLDRETRRALLAAWHRPHREAVTRAVAAHVAAGRVAVHVAVHSFTPVLDGAPRRADVGLLYDPRRPLERALCRAWQAALRAAPGDLRVRRNYPYLGRNDGLTTALRRRFGPADYAGVELELNQALPAGPAGRWRDALRSVADTLPAPR